MSASLMPRRMVKARVWMFVAMCPHTPLVNYSQWMIVSPEASLASLPCVDGYIAQVWTGTSREPNYFKGERKERVFETAFSGVRIHGVHDRPYW